MPGWMPLRLASEYLYTTFEPQIIHSVWTMNTLSHVINLQTFVVIYCKCCKANVIQCNIEYKLSMSLNKSTIFEINDQMF